MSERRSQNGRWFVEGGAEAGTQLWKTDLRRLPQLVGRSVNAEIRLQSSTISTRHAEFFGREGRLWLRDLGSTNGTYVNFEPLRGETALQEDDILHFAGVEFRVGLRSEVATPDVGTRALERIELGSELATATDRVHELFGERGVRPVFQPIVHLNDRRTFGLELLSRGELGGREVPPKELFTIAEQIGRECELSELCRRRGAEAMTAAESAPRLFVNTHPSELDLETRLLESLATLSPMLSGSQLVVEIHEGTMTDPSRVRSLRAALRGIDAQLAFDDFGTGRSRLFEIAEAPPDYLKFDIRLIRGLDRAQDGRRHLVRHLVEVSNEIGITPIAEGIETADELRACLDVGFLYAQGFFLGRPAPIEHFVSQAV